MTNLNNIQWCQTGERWDGENDTSGNPDNFNRANKVIYDVWCVNHNDDGSHKTDDTIVMEQGSFAGNSTDNRDISLTNSALTIRFLMIAARGTEYPVIRTTNMSGDNSKELASNALQSNQIQSISTTGQFQVGADSAVNATGTTYDYIAIGVE